MSDDPPEEPSHPVPPEDDAAPESTPQQQMGADLLDDSDPAPNESEPPQGGAPSPPNGPPQGNGPAGSPGAPPPDPNGGTPAPTPGGGGGGKSQRIKWKRVLLVAGGVGGVVLLVAGIFLIGPSLGGLFGCDAPAPAAEVVHHQSADSNGIRVAVQAASLNGTDHVILTPPSGESVNLTSVGNTTTFTGLSSGSEIQVSAAYKCGEKSLQPIAVK